MPIFWAIGITFLLEAKMVLKLQQKAMSFESSEKGFA